MTHTISARKLQAKAKEGAKLAGLTHSSGIKAVNVAANATRLNIAPKTADNIASQKPMRGVSYDIFASLPKTVACLNLCRVSNS